MPISTYNISGFNWLGPNEQVPSTPAFLFEAANGDRLYMQVKFGSMAGWTPNSGDVQVMSNADYSSTIKTSVHHGRRELSFSALATGVNADALQREIDKLRVTFSQYTGGGKLVAYKATGEVRYLTAIANRSPEVTYISQTAAWVQISLVAPDPYWYAYDLVTDVSGVCVNGGEYPAPVEMTATANTISNAATGDTITAISGQSIIGATITVTDNAISVTQEGANALWKISTASRFFQIVPGSNTISGAGNIKFRPRWDGV